MLFDLDADGHPELLVRSGTRDVIVWHGTPDARFETPSTYNYPDPIFGIALADLDRDGFFELLVTTRDVVTMRRGIPGGRFVASTIDSVLLGGPAGSLVVGDFDADGVVDDVVVLTAVEVVSLRGAGLSLTQADKYPLAGRTALAVGDVNGDGRPDIVIGGSSVFDTLRGIGMGRFMVGSQPVAARIQHVALARITCDGTLSAVIDDQDAQVLVMLNAGGIFTVRATLPAGPIAGLAAGDVNGDGVADLLTLEPGLGLRVFFGTGNATWAGGVRFDYGRANRGVVIEDLDGDGRLDVVIATIDAVEAFRQ